MNHRVVKQAEHGIIVGEQRLELFVIAADTRGFLQIVTRRFRIADCHESTSDFSQRFEAKSAVLARLRKVIDSAYRIINLHSEPSRKHQQLRLSATVSYGNLCILASGAELAYETVK